MAKKPEVEIKPVEPPSRGYTWLWVILAIVTFVLALALLHVVGALRGVEEAAYRKVKNVPVVGFLASPLHRESWEGRLTPEQIIDVKDLRKELIKTQNKVQRLSTIERNIAKINSELKKTTSTLKRVTKDISDIKEGVYVPPTTGAVAARPAAPTAAAPSITVPTTAMAAGAPVTTENYRAVSKIFEKIPAETVVDILNSLSDTEKVEILTSMKEKNVADILAAMEPTVAANLSKMLARRKAQR
jgi:flagellar motility protein MotE (MotC chaperone)